MEELNITGEETFKEMINKIMFIKRQYRNILSFFTYYEIKNKVEFMQQTRNKIYSLNMESWKCDRLWEVINGDMEYKEIRKLKVY